MTPAARQAAAIAILDDWCAGAAPEQALTRWARRSRFAGSKDRAAVRDIVYDCVRAARSFAALGQGEDGRAMVLGRLRALGDDPDPVFSGERFAPDPLTENERREVDVSTLSDAVRYDLPVWVVPLFEASLGNDWRAVAEILKTRAPVFLRVNVARIERAEAQARLADEGIVTVPHRLSETALEVTEGARRVHLSKAYEQGLVEIQDAASQAILDVLGIVPGVTFLDYCAGGGGKALAAAAQGAKVSAHDIDAGRMKDIPGRASRAGATVEILSPERVTKTYEVVFADAPCSGSGSWRRAPHGKWLFSPGRLEELTALQARILDDITAFVEPEGQLAYATCSLLREENEDQVRAFVNRHPAWTCVTERRLTPLDGADGFYIAVLRKTT